MTDEAHLNNLLAMFNERAPIARLFGMSLEFDQDKRAIIHLPYNSDLDHAMGNTHGGVYATMLDNAGWFTSVANRADGGWVATTELSVRFLRPVTHSALRAVGNLIKQGKRQDIVEAHLYDEQAELVGHAIGTFMVLEHIKLE
jgi:uncharacterized protein (TIGR00369 family)